MRKNFELDLMLFTVSTETKIANKDETAFHFCVAYLMLIPSAPRQATDTDFE